MHWAEGRSNHLPLGGYPPPPPDEQICPNKIRSEQECSLDTPFGARDNIVKRR